MQLRLAFAIATAILPEILVLDEVVGAGDAAFMTKAKSRLNTMIGESHIVVLASHNLQLIEHFCNKVLWLDAGRVAYFGELVEGLQFYKKHCNAL